MTLLFTAQVCCSLKIVVHAEELICFRCALSIPFVAAVLCSALVFANIGFFDVGLAVFTGRLGWLAEHIVPCGPLQAKRNHDDWVCLLQQRLMPAERKAKKC